MRSRNMRPILISAIALAVLWVACAASPERQELEAAKAAWVASGVESYTYTYTRSCECDEIARGPNRVTVEDGAVIEVLHLGGDDPVSIDADEWGSTIEDMHEAIARSIDEGRNNNVDYGPLGYPERMVLDVAALQVDGGYSLTVTSFEAVT